MEDLCGGCVCVLMFVQTTWMKYGVVMQFLYLEMRIIQALRELSPCSFSQLSPQAAIEQLSVRFACWTEGNMKAAGW